MLAEPLNSFGLEGKTLKIARNSLKRKKDKEIQKGKEKKIRVFPFFWREISEN